MSEPLATALARAATRYVGESKVGTRRGSVTAVARAMTARGVSISSNTLSRKLAGEYPLNSDEIGALAAVIGVDPDEIWQDALRIMREERANPAGPRVDVDKILRDAPHLAKVREEGQRLIGGKANNGTS